MRIGVDTNVLIYAHLPAFQEHAAVRRYLLAALADSQVSLVLTPLVLHEFVHVVTDSRRFEPPVLMSEAVALARFYLGKSNVECLAVDETSLSLALQMIEQKQLGRKRIADALLAATLLRHGVDRVATCDPNGFSGFDDLLVIDPRLA